MTCDKARVRELQDKFLCLAALGISIELVLLKFLPDIATATIQHGKSTLADFQAFEDTYLVRGTVFYARFLGNYILYFLAKYLAGHYSSADIRLHPLRLAAAIVTPLYVYLGAAPVLGFARDFDWRAFIAPYGLAVIIGLYVFYPGDMPALACLSIGLFFLLRQRLVLALLALLVLGLFRETSFHMVWFVLAWAVSTRAMTIARRMSWVLLFGLAFSAEYVVVRIYFPGPVSSLGALIWDPREVFFGRGLLSLTTLCSLSLASLYPLACWARIACFAPTDWARRFFLLNCLAFPFWIIFYRMLNGNITEFRLLLPAILPCVYGIAYIGATSDSNAVVTRQ